MNKPLLAAEEHGIERAEVEAVNAAAQRPLYVDRVKIFPKRVHGIFRNLKWLFMALALGFYYVGPWLRWERPGDAPDQAILMDLAGRKFYWFFIEIWPQEIYYLTGLLILAALLLFLVTAAFGRVWCGYACPQTVWTDLFIAVERLVEGDRSARIRLDKAKWGAAKLLRRTVKHGLWLAIAMATGGAWVFYFADAPTLMGQLLVGEAPLPAYVFIGLLTLSTYLLGGLAREQVCTYMCPWPRIQAALIDEETFTVTYRQDRGEPRGPLRKNAGWEDRGDCIDCKQCVVACPMGIDIRDGLQLECITCALCIDACNTVMDRIGRPRGLIAYDNDNNMARRSRNEPSRFRLIRARTVLYAALMLVVAAIMTVSLVSRSTLDLNVLRDRNPLYVTLKDGSVRNGFTLKLLNKQHATQHFDVVLVGLDKPRITLPTGERGAPVLTVGPDRPGTFRLFIALPKEEAGRGRQAFTLRVVNRDTGEWAEEETSFHAPK